MRFLLIDRVEEIIPGSKAKGIKAWSLDNAIFEDHFPGFPIVPGVLLTESMAQLSGILIEKSLQLEFNEEEAIFPILSIIQKAKFRSFVRPGDQCRIVAELISLERSRANVNVETFVEDEKIVEAKLSFVVVGKNETRANPFLNQRDKYYHSIMPNSKE
jgi:3-hydroxyacyl-[acyl-carrier-protein] dehydratase